MIWLPTLEIAAIDFAYSALSSTERENVMPAIERVYTRHYRDNDQTTCYVEWKGGSRTEGPAENYHGVLVPIGEHMGMLFDRALAQGLKIEREVW